MVAFNKWGHLAIGVLLALLLGDRFDQYFCLLLGSLLPDIDNRHSTLGRLNPLARFMHHRGKCHTVVGSALLSAPALLFSVHWFWFVFLGCIGHLAGDKLQDIFGGRSFRLRLW